MKRTSGLIRRSIPIVTLAAGLVSAQAQFQLIDNFEAASLGDLNGQNGWAATLAQVKADPADPANQVASFEGTANGGANRAVSVPE